MYGPVRTVLGADGSFTAPSDPMEERPAQLFDVRVYGFVSFFSQFLYIDIQLDSDHYSLPDIVVCQQN